MFIDCAVENGSKHRFGGGVKRLAASAGYFGLNYLLGSIVEFKDSFPIRAAFDVARVAAFLGEPVKLGAQVTNQASARNLERHWLPLWSWRRRMEGKGHAVRFCQWRTLLSKDA